MSVNKQPLLQEPEHKRTDCSVEKARENLDKLLEDIYADRTPIEDRWPVDVTDTHDPNYMG